MDWSDGFFKEKHVVPVCKSKFVCTIGPATAEPVRLRELLLNGMSAARLNFSHCTHDFARQVIGDVRRLAREMRRPVGILLDSNGPKLRTGRVPRSGEGEGGAVYLRKEDIVHFHADEDENSKGTYEGNGHCEHGQSPRILRVAAPGLAELVMAGDKLYVDDGLLAFTVVRSNLQCVECIADNAGWLRDCKGINLPTQQGTATLGARPAAFLRRRERDDLALACALGVEWVTVSCVRSVRDVHEIRAFLQQTSQPQSQSQSHMQPQSQLQAHFRLPRILAKIENKAGVEAFDSILAAADGIVIDRGYLGVEIDLARLATVQRSLIARCIAAGKPVLVANHVLERMCELPRPGRSEAADIAGTVELGVDGFILSAETAIGAYPIEALQWLRRLCAEAEAHATGPFLVSRGPSVDPCAPFPTVTISESIAAATVKCAREVAAAVVIVSTEAGGIARLIAKYRPGVAVVAGCGDDLVAGQLTFSYGIIPIVVGAGIDGLDTDYEQFEQSQELSVSPRCTPMPTPASVVQCALKHAAALKLLQAGDRAVVASGQVDGFLDGSSTFMQVLTVGQDYPLTECD